MYHARHGLVNAVGRHRRHQMPRNQRRFAAEQHRDGGAEPARSLPPDRAHAFVAAVRKMPARSACRCTDALTGGWATGACGSSCCAALGAAHSARNRAACSASASTSRPMAVSAGHRPASRTRHKSRGLWPYAGDDRPRVRTPADQVSPSSWVKHIPRQTRPS